MCLNKLDQIIKYIKKYEAIYYSPLISTKEGFKPTQPYTPTQPNRLP